MHTLRTSAQPRCPRPQKRPLLSGQLLALRCTPAFANPFSLGNPERRRAVARSASMAARIAPFSNDLRPLQILRVNNHGSRDSDCRMRAER